MKNDTKGHGLTSDNTSGCVSILMNGKEIRSRYFTNRYMRREIQDQWDKEIKRLQKLNKEHDFEISIILHI